MKKEKINILGIDISLGNKNNFASEIEMALDYERQLFVTTPNPEIILEANKNEELHYILNYSDLSIADGIGIVFAALLIGKKISRWPGSDICTWLMTVAESKNKKVAIMPYNGGLSTKAEIEKTVKQKYPKLDFVVVPIEKEWHLSFYKELNVFQPNILFVATGSPSQEKFIYHNIKKMPFVNVAMGVGGSFDYITGKIKASPQLFKKLGIEWLWRLINIFSFTFPYNRLKRIIKAVFIFPLYFLKWLLINPFFYRENVSCLIFKREALKYKILVIKNLKEAEQWQAPQGGTDGQSIEIAGLREIQEELGTYKVRPIGSYKNLHKYKFNKKINRAFRNYKGQKQGLLIAEFNGRDDEIELNYWEYKSWKWVDMDKFVETVHPVRREAAQKFVEIFKKRLHC